MNTNTSDTVKHDTNTGTNATGSSAVKTLNLKSASGNVHKFNAIHVPTGDIKVGNKIYGIQYMPCGATVKDGTLTDADTTCGNCKRRR